MAKKTQSKPTKQDEQPPIDEQPDGEWEEIGDFWDSMFLFEGEGATFDGIYQQSVADIGPNKSKVHIFLRDGIRVGVWGSAVLDRRMEGVEPGRLTRIKHCGEAVSGESGRTYKEFKIWQKKQPVVLASNPNDDIPY